MLAKVIGNAEIARIALNIRDSYEAEAIAHGMRLN
jgi:hypothetical protein